MKKVISLIACFSIAVFAQNEQKQYPSQQLPQAVPPPQNQQQQEYLPQQAYPPPQQVVPQQQPVIPPQQYQYPPQQAYPPPQQVVPQQQVIPQQQYQYPPQQAYPPPQAVPPQQLQPAQNCTQEQEKSAIRYGLRAGLNLSSLSLDDNDFSFGWQVGVVADIGSKYFFFHPGIIFIGKGAEYSVKPVEATSSMYYIEAPLLLSFKPIPEFRINVGHYVSYGLFGTIETTTTIGNNTVSSKEKSFKFFDEFDFGLSLGVGIEIKQYYVGLNYEFGLIDIAEEGSEEINNQTWALTLGYYF